MRETQSIIRIIIVLLFCAPFFTIFGAKLTMTGEQPTESTARRSEDIIPLQETAQFRAFRSAHVIAELLKGEKHDYDKDLLRGFFDNKLIPGFRITPNMRAKIRAYAPSVGLTCVGFCALADAVFGYSGFSLPIRYFIEFIGGGYMFSVGLAYALLPPPFLLSPPLNVLKENFNLEEIKFIKKQAQALIALELEKFGIVVPAGDRERFFENLEKAFTGISVPESRQAFKDEIKRIKLALAQAASQVESGHPDQAAILRKLINELPSSLKLLTMGARNRALAKLFKIQAELRALAEQEGHGTIKEALEVNGLLAHYRTLPALEERFPILKVVNPKDMQTLFYLIHSGEKVINEEALKALAQQNARLEISLKVEHTGGDLFSVQVDGKILTDDGRAQVVKTSVEVHSQDRSAIDILKGIDSKIVTHSISSHVRLKLDSLTGPREINIEPDSVSVKARVEANKQPQDIIKPTEFSEELASPIEGTKLYIDRSHVLGQSNCTVYAGFLEDTETGRGKRVAIKMGKKQEDAAHLRRQLQVQGSLHHKNIIKIHGISSTEAGIPYLVMEVVEGITLRDYITELGLETSDTLTPQVIKRARKVFYIIEQVALALEAAHKHGVIHRDIKPENILLTRDGRVKLTDFESMSEGEGGEELWHSLRRSLEGSEGVKGTLAYMAPEARVPGRPITAAADVYSLGIVFFEAMRGEVPEVADDKLPSAIDPVYREIQRRAEVRMSAGLFGWNIQTHWETILGGKPASDDEITRCRMAVASNVELLSNAPQPTATEVAPLLRSLKDRSDGKEIRNIDPEPVQIDREGAPQDGSEIATADTGGEISIPRQALDDKSEDQDEMKVDPSPALQDDREEIATPLAAARNDTNNDIRRRAEERAEDTLVEDERFEEPRMYEDEAESDYAQRCEDARKSFDAQRASRGEVGKRPSLERVVKRGGRASPRP